MAILRPGTGKWTAAVRAAIGVALLSGPGSAWARINSSSADSKGAAKADAPGGAEASPPQGAGIDTTPPASPADQGSPGNPLPSRRRHHLGSGSADHYDDGLDLKLTGFFDRRASNLTSPTMLIAAQWNYRFATATDLGLGAAGSPQSLQDDVPATAGRVRVTRRHTTYYAGLNLAQTLWSSDSARVVIGMLAGRGILFLRLTPEGQTSTFTSVKYNVYEPFIYGTFLRRWGLDIGGVVSYRAVRVEDASLASNADLSAIAFGLTFRAPG